MKKPFVKIPFVKIPFVKIPVVHSIIILCLVIYTSWLVVYAYYYNYAYMLHSNEKQSVDILKNYFISRFYNHEKTSKNIWANTLPKEISRNVENIASDIQEQIKKLYGSDNVIYIPELTEVSITGSTTKNSEKVFFTRHYDGPFLLHPCKIDRVIVALSGTPKVSTVFPNTKISLNTYEAMLFDYDRTPHYIIQNPTHNSEVNTEPRIMLRLQYYINPRSYFSQMCLKSHINWGRYSRMLLENNKNNIDVKTRLGIIATNMSTYMVFFALASLIMYIAFVITTNLIYLVLFIIIIVWMVGYYSYGVLLNYTN